MLERINPLLRLVCLALTGLIIFQISQIATKRPVIAHSSFEAPKPKAAKTNEVSTNTVSTNVVATNVTSTNVVSKTNSPPNAASKRPGGPSRPLTGAMMMGMGGPGGAVNVPPEIQSAVDKIKQSGTLGVEVKPPPMALIGIAGKDVFMRGPHGMEGTARAGEEFDGVKIIRIGINRVLVEEGGQQKELTLFNGFGSETLLPQKKNEPPHH